MAIMTSYNRDGIVVLTLDDRRRVFTIEDLVEHIEECHALLLRVNRQIGGDVLYKLADDRDALLEGWLDSPKEEPLKVEIEPTPPATIDPPVGVFEVYRTRLGSETWAIDYAHGKRVSKQEPKHVVFTRPVLLSEAYGLGLGTRLFLDWKKGQKNAASQN